MEKISLQNICKTNTKIDNDTFVGISYDNGEISISFPLGYHLSTTDIKLREDIFLLIKTISRNSDREESEISQDAQNFSDRVSFPIQAYLYLIRDYAENGYYKETEPQYVKAKRGKINWSKTIKTQKPFIQEENAFYLDFIIKKDQINMNELITLIHEFCVYESYQKMGWLFTDYMPPKPNIKFQDKLFVAVINGKLNHTFNDKNKRLFQNMLAIVTFLGDSQSATKYTYGTNNFEHIWEKMIDRVYGIRDKKEYYPSTFWDIDGDDKDNDNLPLYNSSLKPDTIMKWNNNIYVLDAKYYQYGRTKLRKDLPQSPDINKQITYAEYIAESGKFGKPVVYNAFVLPFDSMGNEDHLFYVGSARGNWKSNKKTYECIHGILLDVKHLMERSSGHNDQEIERIARLIEKKKRHQ